MNIDRSQETPNLVRFATAFGLLVAAGVIAFFFLPTVVQAFRGPRPITEAELLATPTPGWWDNYVRYTPPPPAAVTGVRFGKRGNEGTKYVVLPVADRTLFCSARVDYGGPEYVGRLETLGNTEQEAAQMSGAAGPKLLPFMLQSVRSIWFDSVAAMLGVAGCLGGATWAAVLMALSGRAPQRQRS